MQRYLSFHWDITSLVIYLSYCRFKLLIDTLFQLFVLYVDMYSHLDAKLSNSSLRRLIKHTILLLLFFSLYSVICVQI